MARDQHMIIIPTLIVQQSFLLSLRFAENFGVLSLWQWPEKEAKNPNIPNTFPTGTLFAKPETFVYDPLYTFLHKNAQKVQTKPLDVFPVATRKAEFPSN